MAPMPRNEALGSEQQRASWVKETHSDDGVDLTLIRWMLSLTPAERLEILQQTVWSIQDLRGDQA